MNGSIIIMPDGTRINLANVISYTVVGTAVQFTTIQSTSSYYSWDSGNANITAQTVKMIDWFVARGFAISKPPDVLDIGNYVVLYLSLMTTTGTAAGGTSVEIDCATSPGTTNFIDGCVVYMNGQPCTTVWTSNVKITFTTIAQIEGTPNPADILVANPDGTNYLALGAFTWTP